MQYNAETLQYNAETLQYQIAKFSFAEIKYLSYCNLQFSQNNSQRVFDGLEKRLSYPVYSREVPQVELYNFIDDEAAQFLLHSNILYPQH